jgi:hypothetical protein
MLFIKMTDCQLHMVVHNYNSSTKEVEAGGLQVQGQPGQHSKTPSQQKKPKQTEKNQR